MTDDEYKNIVRKDFNDIILEVLDSYSTFHIRTKFEDLDKIKVKNLIFIINKDKIYDFEGDFCDNSIGEVFKNTIQKRYKLSQLESFRITRELSGSIYNTTFMLLSLKSNEKDIKHLEFQVKQHSDLL